jgi:hypothetical protein
MSMQKEGVKDKGVRKQRIAAAIHSETMTSLSTSSTTAGLFRNLKPALAAACAATARDPGELRS